MRNKKDLILVLSLTALLGLTSCTKPAPAPEPEPEPEPVLKEWTDLEKKQMVQLGGMVFPAPTFDQSAVELVLPDIEEGYIQTSGYDIQINMTKVAQADFDAWLAKTAEDNEWEEDGEEGGFLYYYEYLTDDEASSLSAQIKVDAEGGTISIFPIAFSWSDVIDWYNMQAANCNVEKTFEGVFGENFPSYSTKTSVFWTTGALTKLADYSAKGWDSDAYPMVEIYDNTAAAEAAFKEGLANANYHIFGWTRKDGTQNQKVYTSGDATIEGGLLFQQLGSNRGNLVYLLDGYTDAKYHEGDDICHPEIVTEKIEKISSEDNVDTFRVTLSDGSTFEFTVGQDPEDPTKILITAPEGHTVAISEETGNWVVDGKDTGIKAELDVEVKDPNELAIDEAITHLDSQFGAGFMVDQRTFGLGAENTEVIGEGAYQFTKTLPDVFSDPELVPAGFVADEEASVVSEELTYTAGEGEEAVDYKYHELHLVFKKGDVVMTLDATADVSKTVYSVEVTLVTITLVNTAWTDEYLDSIFNFDDLAAGAYAGTVMINGSAPKQLPAEITDLSAQYGFKATWLGYGAWSYSMGYQTLLGYVESYGETPSFFEYKGFDQYKDEATGEDIEAGAFVFESANGRFQYRIEVYADLTKQSFSAEVLEVDYVLIDLESPYTPETPVEGEEAEGGEELLRTNSYTLAVVR